MIAIIGGGISGLSTAWTLHQKKTPYRLFESSSRIGGNIKSCKIRDYWLEFGPNSILYDPQVEIFLKRLSLSKELIRSYSISKNRYILKDQRYQKFPSNLISLLLTRMLSFSAKRSIFKEMYNCTKSPEDETLGDFFERRFNKEIVDTCLIPFIRGIYAGDAYHLLVKEIFPVLLQYEDQYGSVVKGLFKNRKNTHRKWAYNFKNGMISLPEAMAKNLHISLETPIEKIERIDKTYFIHSSKTCLKAKAIVLSLPAHSAALIMKKLHPLFSRALLKVNYPPLGILHSVFKKNDIQQPLKGFGGLNPSIANSLNLGTIWNSNIFPYKAPKTDTLLTTFIGDINVEYSLIKNKKELCQKVTRELQKVHQIKSDPIFQHFFLWEKSIPQYDKDILSVIRHVRYLEGEKIFICANWLKGVSLPDCIKKGEKLGKKVASLFT